MPGVIAAWDANKPAGSTDVNTGDDDIRANNAALAVMMGAEMLNLVVQWASVTTVDIDADRIPLFNTAGTPLCLAVRAVNLTAAITTDGANGLDAGAATEANSTWYYIWVIYNPTTDVVAALLSVSATSPTMPADYTFKRLVGAVYNNSSGDFWDFIQHGNKVTHVTPREFISAGRSDAAWTEVALGPYVPMATMGTLALPFTKHIDGYIEMTHNQASGSYAITWEIAANSGGNYLGTKISALLLSSSGAVNIGGAFEQMTYQSSVWYRTTDGAPATISVDAYVQGYELRI